MAKTAEVQKKLTIVTVDGAGYLGHLVEGKDNKYTITQSITLPEGAQVGKQTLVNYLVAANTNKLNKDIIIRGTNATFGEQELSDELELTYDILLRQYEQAQKQTVPELEAERFKQLAR